MADALSWYAALALLGGASLLPAALLFRSLPSRGVLYTRALGLALLAYLAWLPGAVGIGYGAGAAWAALAALLSLSAYLAWQRPELWRAVWAKRRLLLQGELLFLLLYGALVLVRSRAPDARRHREADGPAAAHGHRLGTGLPAGRPLVRGRADLLLLPRARRRGRARGPRRRGRRPRLHARRRDGRGRGGRRHVGAGPRPARAPPARLPAGERRRRAPVARSGGRRRRLRDRAALARTARRRSRGGRGERRRPWSRLGARRRRPAGPGGGDRARTGPLLVVVGRDAPPPRRDRRVSRLLAPARRPPRAPARAPARRCRARARSGGLLGAGAALAPALARRRTPARPRGGALRGARHDELVGRGDLGRRLAARGGGGSQARRLAVAPRPAGRRALPAPAGARCDRARPPLRDPP